LTQARPDVLLIAPSHSLQQAPRVFGRTDLPGAAALIVAESAADAVTRGCVPGRGFEVGPVLDLRIEVGEPRAEARPPGKTVRVERLLLRGPLTRTVFDSTFPSEDATAVRHVER
jgi:hypothetical protein